MTGTLYQIQTEYINTNHVNFLSFDNDDTTPSKSSFHCIVDFCFEINYCSKIKNWEHYQLYFSPRTLKNSFLIAVVFFSFFSFQIDIFSSEIRSSALMYLSHANLNSINSLNVFHPSVNKLASGNSSEKVYLWTE